MNPVLSYALPAALVILVLAMGCSLVPVLRGPTAQDRVLALDCLAAAQVSEPIVDMAGVGIVDALLENSGNYFEAALLIALLGFVSSMAMAKFLLRGEVIE